MILKNIHFEPETEFDFISEKSRDSDDMPMVKELLAENEHTSALKGVTVLLIQHQFSNQLPLVESLNALGVEYKDIYWLDIPYTSSDYVRKSLKSIPIENFFIHKYDVTKPYATYQRTRIQELYIELLEMKPNKLLVLDDGAYFLETIATFKEKLLNICIVEQTSRGIFKIEENSTLKLLSTEIPIINVAQSKPKIELEAPFVGIAINSSLRNALKKIKGDFQSWNCLILGYGAIGRNVARFINESIGIRTENTYVFDINPKNLKKAINVQFKIWDKNDFKTKFNLVIGCTGKSSFKIGDAVYLEDNAILVSASSGASELSRQEFIELADSSDVDDIVFEKSKLNVKEIHSTLIFNILGKKINFLNGGFPINFDGINKGIPNKFIEPTILMMLKGSIQAIDALKNNKKGILPLDSNFAERLRFSFLKKLKEEGYSFGNQDI